MTPDLYIDVGKLSERDICGIIRQWKKGKPVRELAEYHSVTRQRIYQIISSYEKTGQYPYPKTPGRKPGEIPYDIENLILSYHDKYYVGPCHLENQIEKETKIHIPHNTTYRVLLNHGRVEICMKKRRQRKWVRYEREHSMSLWQGDWKMVKLNNNDYWLVAFIDDSSRLVTCYGVFDRPTTMNTIKVLEKRFEQYGIPREILTDNGTQFVSARNSETAEHNFKKFLEFHGIKHIRARVHHPQTNGKIERFFGEVERRAAKFGSIDAVVSWHNELKPHSSLDYNQPVNFFFYRLPPERIMNYAQRWMYA